MNEILKQMIERRSIRKYKTEPVPQDILDTIINAGLYAASGRNSQETVIIAVTNKEVIDKMSKINAEIMGTSSDPFFGAPAVLVVLAKKDRTTGIYDGSLVIGNLMLAAHSLGLASCWVHRAKQTFEMPEWKEWLLSLGIEGDYEGVGNCVIGYPDAELPPPPQRKENRVFYVK